MLMPKMALKASRHRPNQRYGNYPSHLGKTTDRLGLVVGCVDGTSTIRTALFAGNATL
jgi:hypothetical protein